MRYYSSHSLLTIYDSIISPELGNMKLNEIKSSDIQNLIDKRANPPHGSKIKPLSYSSLKKILEFLNPCLKQAIKDGLIASNPCEDVVLPKQSTISVETKSQFSLSDKQIELFREAALKKTKSGEYRRDGIVLLLIISLGTRVGEMLALEKNDIHVEEKYIVINKTIQSSVKNYHDKSQPKRYDKLKMGTKTSAGTRTIPINDSVEDLLTLLNDYDARNGIVSPYVVCTSTGKRGNARNLQRSLDRILSNVDMGELPHKITLHTLRHTFGSAMLRRGAPISVVSALMGHSDTVITYKKYIHVIQDEKIAAVNKIQIV